MLMLPITIVFAEDEYEMAIYIEYLPFENIEEMGSASSDIVQLEILDERAEWVNVWVGLEDTPDRLYDVYTIHRARVLNVFQGDLEIGEIIEVRQMGGILDGTTLENPSMINFSYGDNVVLFLGEAVTSHFVIMLPYQAAYFVSDDGSLLRAHPKRGFDDLGLTWEILGQIQQDNENNPTGDNGADPSDTGIVSNDNDNIDRNDETETDASNETNTNYENDVETHSIAGTDESGGHAMIGIIVTGIVVAIVFIVMMRRKKNEKDGSSAKDDSK